MRPWFALALLLCACPTEKTSPEKSADPAPPADPIAATVTAAMDTNADPCNDFYRYACGGWVDNSVIPGDQSRWSRSFSVIRESNQTLLEEILKQSAAEPGEDPGQQLLGAYFGSCMDTDAIDAAGFAPLQADLKAAAAVKSLDDLMTVAGTQQSHSGAAVLFDGGVFADFEDPGLNIMHLGQGGLGLPDRDYYLKTDAESLALLTDYEANVVRFLVLAGTETDTALAEATAIVAFEAKVAAIQLPRAELRDPQKTYHRLERAGLQELTPSLNWDLYWAAAGNAELTAINVSVPTYFSALETLIAETVASEGGIDTLRSYLRWHIVKASAPRLNAPFRDAHFEFFKTRLAGQKEQKPRWKQCVDATQSSLGELLGQAYVDRRFSGESKPTAVAMIEDIVDAFATALPELEWMDEETRARAVEKARALDHKIGYPDEWKDYSELNLAGGWFGNARAADSFETARQLAKVGNPVDKGEWFMPPSAVNAYYNPLFGEIVFPAGILQPPFFSADFPPAMNYGSIGMVMGHELSHGFDDSGRKFDAEGRMREWWAPEVAARYEERAACVEEQYNGYELREGMAVNGKLTLGENIADIAGIKQAHQAWRSSGLQDPAAASIVSGVTNDQLFFLAFAQGWCSLATPEIEQMLLTVDSHSPALFRVNGPLVNYPGFAEAYSCAAGTRFAPEQRCEIW